MKIGILTQPLHDNYGGLLQAFALKTTLESLGHQVEIINRRKDTISLIYNIRRLLSRMLGRGRKFTLSSKQKTIISQHTRHFAKTYIRDITPPIYSTSGLKAIENRYDCFIVGSDQCWRPRYSPKLSNYFLDFVKNSKTIAFSYAASFGVDVWELTEKETEVCKANIHKFNAISVREKSAIKLCKDYLGVTATHVLDPTMLLTEDVYVNLIKMETAEPRNGKLLHYVLDSDEQKESLIQYVSDTFGYNVFSAHQKTRPNASSIKNIDDCIYPKVTTWLNSFRQAEFVITDSFHGTVFSILFNKPFLVVSNPRRGKSRFDSLLEIFGLQDRLIHDLEKFDKASVTDLPEINWSYINRIVQEKRESSLSFLKSNLS